MVCPLVRDSFLSVWVGVSRTSSDAGRRSGNSVKHHIGLSSGARQKVPIGINKDAKWFVRNVELGVERLRRPMCLKTGMHGLCNASKFGGEYLMLEVVFTFRFGKAKSLGMIIVHHHQD